MLRFALFLAFTLSVLVAPVSARVPERIVSLNLCTDQYLLALADREQIAAVTNLATDPGMSAAADLAAGLPQTGGSAEEVIALDPDLVVGGTFSLRVSRMLLARMGYDVLALPPDESFAAIRETARRLADAVGHPERGERLVAELDAAIASGPASRGRKTPTALYYQRRGFANGSRSLVSEIMEAAGLRNLAEDLGLTYTGRVELERVVVAQPDYLLVDSLTPRVDDQGSYMLRHPALARSVSPARRLVLPRALVICGGPMTAGAVRRLAAQIRTAE